MTNVVPMIEKRLHTRHRAKTKVSVRPATGDAKMCQAVNLSANGVAVLTEGMGLKAGQLVELSFAINLGAVTKIHRREAKLVYVKNGITGFMM